MHLIKNQIYAKYLINQFCPSKIFRKVTKLLHVLAYENLNLRFSFFKIYQVMKNVILLIKSL